MTSPFDTLAMRPRVSSSVLYVDLLFRISTTSTTPSSHGMSVVATRISWLSPQACAIEATLSTTTVFICMVRFPCSAGSVPAGPRVENARQRQHLRVPVGLACGPLADGFAVRALGRLHQRVLRGGAFHENRTGPEQHVHLAGDALLRRDEERLDVATDRVEVLAFVHEVA